MRFQELSKLLSEDEMSDLATYRQWEGTRPISRNGRRYDGRVLKDDDLVRVWRSVPKGRDPSVFPGSWVTCHTDYLDSYAGRDWQEKTTWITAEIPARELVDAQIGDIDGDTLIFMPEETR